MNSIVLLLLILPCTWSNPMNRANSRVTERRHFFGGITEFQSCGSSLVDTFRFICEMEVWSSEMCLRAKRSFCKNRTRKNSALCSANCTTQPQNNLFAFFNNDGIRIKKSTPGEDYTTASIEEIMEYFFLRMRDQRRRQRQTENETGGDNLRSRSHRTKRDISFHHRINERCCKRKCSIAVLASYCSNASLSHGNRRHRRPRA